jgi:predicted PurR-regulated permease PerM
VFGLAGIVVGPVLMSLFLAILRIYERETDELVPPETIDSQAPGKVHNR